MKGLRFLPSQAACALLLLLTGCGATFTRYATSASSLSAPGAVAARRYIVLSSMPGVDTTNLQFVEARSYLDEVLSARGFAASSFDSADVAVFMSYGIGDPRNQQVVYSVPVFGRAPGSSTTVTGTAVAAGRTTTVSGQARTESDWGLLGYRAMSANQTSYMRHLLLVGVDLMQFRRDQSVRELWRTAVISSGSSGDLRRVLPVLFVAIEPHVATRTPQMVDRDVSESDARLAALRRAAAAIQ